MARVDFTWYDGFFLSMLVTTITIAAINWQKYHLCMYPLHIWTVVDYATVFIFRLLMLLDNAIANGMGLDLRVQQTHALLCGRIIVLSVLALLVYPFLFTWTIIGTLWFIRSKSCLSENGQKFGLLIWLFFSYCALLGIICTCIAKWYKRRLAHQLRARQGVPYSEYRVLTDLVRVPDWAFETADQERSRMGQDAVAFHLERYLSQAQSGAVEALIEELPKFELKAVPTDRSGCLICLEEFQVGNEIRGLPCAHNFHVECIDKWLRLNTKCPGCRSSVFPNHELIEQSIIQEESSAIQRYLSRLQSLSRHVRSEQATSGSDVDSIETPVSWDSANEALGLEDVESIHVIVD